MSKCKSVYKKVHREAIAGNPWHPFFVPVSDWANINDFTMQVDEEVNESEDQQVLQRKPAAEGEKGGNKTL